MEGLDKFREAFEAYSDNYVIIGGTACNHNYEAKVTNFRIEMINFVSRFKSIYIKWQT